jgi:hyperosmotically inducible periplasmic protein
MSLNRPLPLLGVVVLFMSVASVVGPQSEAAGLTGPSIDQQTRNVIKDGWISMKIHSQFIPEDALEGSNIDVDTVKGIVTLTGTIPTEAARTRAIAIARATEGVTNVIDETRVGPAEKVIDPKVLRETGRTTGRMITDGWVKAKIYSQFIPEKTLEDSDIDVDITMGAVTLQGTVKSEAGRTRALAIAKTTAGVKSVKDELKIN